MEKVLTNRVVVKAADKEVIAQIMAAKAAKKAQAKPTTLQYLDREAELLKLASVNKIANALEVVADALKLSTADGLQLLVNAIKTDPAAFARESEEIALLVDDILEDGSLRAASALRRKQELKAMEPAVRALCSEKTNALYNAEVVRAMAESQETKEQLHVDIVECFHNYEGSTLKGAFYADNDKSEPDEAKVVEDNYCIVPQDGSDAPIGDYSWLQDKLRKQQNNCHAQALDERAAIQGEIDAINAFILAHPEFCKETESSKQYAAIQKAEQAQRNFNSEELAKAVEELKAHKAKEEEPNKYGELEKLAAEFGIDF